MSYGLSPQNEQYLQEIVAGGMFPSEEAALNAAMAALREKHEDVPLVPDEHMEAVEQGLAEVAAGLCRPMTPEDWAGLRKLARDTADRKQQGGD